MQRIPKLRGFKNPFRIDYTPVNISALQDLGTDAIDLAGFVALGLARKNDLVRRRRIGHRGPPALRT